MSTEEPRTKPIRGVREESPTVKTVMVEDSGPPTGNPGQFMMVWVPDSGEIPLAVSGKSNETIQLTVKRRGDTSERLHELGPGDQIGLRGPFGNGFSAPSGSCLLVAGGYGIAPLRRLYRSASDEAELSVVAGAATEEELLFVDELDPIQVATEDGSSGHRGNVIEPTRKVLESKRIDRVYTAGPEKMIQEIYGMCKERGIGLEASLERVMKCGVGICGSCLIDGFRVCQDGPVANLQQLDQLEEFGEWERTFSGKREAL